MSSDHSAEGSGGHFYDLSEIPFEPTGAAADKYPYVAPKRFNEIELKIDEVVREKKLYVILFRAPQGGGKTATTTELKRRVSERKYAGGKGAFIFNKLINLNFANYSEDFIKEAEPLLPEFKWEKYKGRTSPGELRNAITSVLKKLGTEFKFVVWAIDEFDILVDYPRAQQSEFLQILREIVDELSNEHIPLLFIMSHTVKSSKEFEKHLKAIHGPLQSRVVAILDIGYTYAEVRAIVSARLRSVREKEKVFNSIEPFTEESLRELYNLILVSGGTGELNDFRLFERCCYFAILNGARTRKNLIDPELVKEEFQRQYKSWAKTDDGEKLSLGLRSDRNTILVGAQMARNDATLKGLIKGLLLMPDQFSEITSVFTRYVERLTSDVHLSTLEFNVIHKPTGKKVSSVWVLAAREDGTIVQDDMKIIDSALPKALAKGSAYTNLSVLGYVSDLELDASNVTNCSRVIRISPETVRDLIGLSISSATEDDIEALRKNFDSEIAWFVRKIFDESTRDITKQASPSVLRLAKALNVSNAAGMKLSKDGLKEEEKKLFGSSTKPADKQVAELISLGFAKEEGTQIVPTEPKALSHLNEMFRTEEVLKLDRVQAEFGPNAESVMNAAESLGLVTIDEDRMTRTSPKLRKLTDEKVESVKPLLTKEVRETFDGGKGAEILRAAEKATADTILGTIVLSAALEFLPSIENRLRSGRQTPLPRPTEESGRNATETEKTAKPRQTQLAREPGKLEEAILSILKEKQPITVEELKKELAVRGFPTDVTSQILGMVMQSKVKLSA